MLSSGQNAERGASLAELGTWRLAADEWSGSVSDRTAQRNIANALALGLGADEVHWLDRCWRTDEASTLFSYLTGCNVLNGSAQRCPEDEVGLASCEALLEASPALRGRLPQMAELGGKWGILATAWDALVALMDSEAPDWRTGELPVVPGLRLAIRKLQQATAQSAVPGTSKEPAMPPNVWDHGCNRAVSAECPPTNPPYRVEYLHGCIVVRGGEFPFESLEGYLEAYGIDPSQCIVSARHGRRIGAAMVCGSRTALRRLEASGEVPADWVQEDVHRAFECGLGAPAMEWLNSYNRTEATDTMFSHLTKCSVMHGAPSKAPGCADSFAACVRMAESVPHVQERLDQMSEISPQWAVLVGAWEPLVALMAEECPDWRARSFEPMPRTQAVLRGLIRATGAEPPPSLDEVSSGTVNRIEVGHHLAGLVAITIDAKRYFLLNGADSEVRIDVGARVEFSALNATITSPNNVEEAVACARIVSVDGQAFE